MSDNSKSQYTNRLTVHITGAMENRLEQIASQRDEPKAEVVRAALAGLTNEEIAVTRGRSIFTVQNQLAAAWRKLGVSSRHEAAALLAGLPEP